MKIHKITVILMIAALFVFTSCEKNEDLYQEQPSTDLNKLINSLDLVKENVTLNGLTGNLYHNYLNTDKVQEIFIPYPEYNSNKNNDVNGTFYWSIRYSTLVIKCTGTPKNCLKTEQGTIFVHLEQENPGE